MDKRVNTVLFILGATVVNILIMAILAVIGMLILSLIPISENAAGVRNLLMIIIFFAAIVGSFFIYHRIVKLISSKIDMEKYFHPIFKDRGKKSGDGEGQV